MINYDREINKIDTYTCSKNIIALLNLNRRNIYGEKVDINSKKLEEMIISYLDNVQLIFKDKELSKNFKDTCKRDQESYFSNNDPKRLPPFHVLSKNIEQISREAWKLLLMNGNFDLIRLIFDNFIHTITRIYEFPYYSDKELTDLNKNLSISDDLNILNKDKCAYKDSLKSNVYEDMYYQESNIKKFLSDNHIKVNFGTKEVIIAMEKLVEGIDSGEDNSDFAKYIRAVRNENAHEKVKDLEINGLTAEYLMTKFSGSSLSDLKPVSELIKIFGLRRIDNVMGNYFTPVETKIDWGNFSSTIPIKLRENLDYTKIAYGKGDCYKLRIVGQVATPFQNYISPLYEALVKCQKDFPSVATFDHAEKMKETINSCDDAFGIDYTGYSDFLSRNLYKWIMERLYKWDKKTVDNVMKILEFPIKIKGKDYDIPFGSMQGIRISFPFITDGNLTMSKISSILREDEDSEAKSVGDDKIVSKKKGKFSKEDIDTELAVAVFFNCIINLDKTESWSGNGTVSFCKITYDRYKRPISGLSGNSLLKEKIFINDISSIFKHFDKTGLLGYIKELFPEEIFFIEDWIDNFLEANNHDIKSGYKYFCYNNTEGDKSLDESYREFIDNSRRIPYEWGGLGLEEFTDFRYYLRAIYSTLSNLMYEPDKFNTSLINFVYKANLSKHKFSKKLLEKDSPNDFDIIGLMGQLDKMSQSIKVDMEEMKEVREKLNRILEYELKTSEGKSNISTKNRSTPFTSSDKLLYINNDFDRSIFNTNLVEKCYLIKSKIKKRERLYMVKLMNYKKLYNQYSDKLVQYNGYNNSYLGYKVNIAMEDGSEEEHIIRIEAKESNYVGSSVQFIKLDKVSFSNEKERDFIIISREIMNESKDIRDMIIRAQDIGVDLVKEFIENKKKDIVKKYFERKLKKIVEEKIEKFKRKN
jgi:hypothetical protein